MATEVLNKVNPVGQLVDKLATRVSMRKLQIPPLPALLAKAREEDTKGNLIENNGPDLNSAADECTSGRVHASMRCEGGRGRGGPGRAVTWLRAADVKEPVALAPAGLLEIRVLPTCTKLHCQGARAPAPLQNGSLWWG